MAPFGTCHNNGLVRDEEDDDGCCCNDVTFMADISCAMIRFANKYDAIVCDRKIDGVAEAIVLESDTCAKTIYSRSSILVCDGDCGD